MNDLEKRVLEKIRPTEDEEAEMLAICEELLGKVEKESRKVDDRIFPILVGSVSRGTWLNYEKDIDIFLKFPIEYEERDLEEITTKLTEEILDNPKKRHAQHPYVTGGYKGYEVEYVPCFDIENTSQLKSAVDRTPFHDKFIKANMKGNEDEVRLLKQFLRGIGGYGAEAEVEGFSGYLCELLIICYGSFENVINSGSKWSAQQVIDTSNEYGAEEAVEKFSTPLVFIDPVDRNRNVASALSEQRFYEFVVAAREYINKPRERFFFPNKRKINKSTLLDKFKKRGTTFVAIVFSKPDIVEDILYPQIRKACQTLKNILKDNDFKLIGADFKVSKDICILIELEALELPSMRLHYGPTVNSDHEERFLEKYVNFKGKLTEPFITDDRWCVILKRNYMDAKTLLKDFLSQKNIEKKGIPKYISKEVKHGFRIKINEEVFSDEFLEFLADYLDPRFPWEF
ncbi:MAG: CCA tRNA nucleotidyltransferase [Candidatus Hydrothermarchaeales archaeon]